MKLKYIKKTAFSLLLTLFAGGVAAQSLNSAYFLDGYTYRHELNPAYMGESYFSFPGLGNINVAMRGNVGLDNFLYKLNDPNSEYDLTTFLSPTVDREKFLKDLKDNNKLQLNASINIFSIGFKSFGGFNTIGLNVRASTGVNLPYGLLDFAKTGMDGNDTHYKVDDLSVRATGYVEMAFGHARKINENLSVGAKMKVLFGGADIDATVEKMDIRMSNEQWLVKARSKMNTSLKGATYETSSKGYVDGIDVDSPGLGGWGLGFDLGATYKFTDGPLENLTLSAALLDLGFISWSDNIVAANDSEEFVFDGFENIAINSKGENQKLGDQYDDMIDRLEELYNVRPSGSGSRTTALAATLNIGAQYPLPSYDKLVFGFLSSTRFNGPFTWSEARLSANVTPKKWFGAAVNYAYSTYGSSFGMVANFHPKGFNFFIGTDHMIGKVNSQFIPMNSRGNISLGFNFIMSKN